PPYRPPAAKPRARIVALVGRATPVCCQPPAIRSPDPRWIQSAPLVEASKIVRQISGPEPPRSQVMFEPSIVRLSVAGSVLFNRPIQLRVSPPNVVNPPPARILPSVCTARE